jgi:hypothetical protein
MELMYDYSDNYSRLSNRGRKVVLVTTKALFSSYLLLSIALLVYLAHLVSHNFLHGVQLSAGFFYAAIAFQLAAASISILGLLASYKDQRTVLLLTAVAVVVCIFVHVTASATVTFRYGTQVDKNLEYHWNTLGSSERLAIQETVRGVICERFCYGVLTSFHLFSKRVAALVIPQIDMYRQEYVLVLIQNKPPQPTASGR